MTAAAQTLHIMLDQLEDCVAEVRAHAGLANERMQLLMRNRDQARQRLIALLKTMTLEDLASL